METVTILRLLWARRLWVSVGALVAVAAGMLVAFHVSLVPPGLESRQYRIGQASIAVLIDTPSSQVADLAPPVGSEVLEARSTLFANLLATGEVQALVANNAGIRPDQLQTIAPSSKTNPVATRIATEALGTSGPAGLYHLIVTIDAPPIISIRAEAPDAEAAARLANGAVAALRTHLDRVAAVQRIPPRRKAVVTPLGSAAAGDVIRGPGRVYALIATMLVFGLVCMAIVFFNGLARSWREAAEYEATRDAGPLQEPRRVVGDSDEPTQLPTRPTLTGTTAPPGRSRPKMARDESDTGSGEFDRPERVSSVWRKR